MDNNTNNALSIMISKVDSMMSSSSQPLSNIGKEDENNQTPSRFDPSRFYDNLKTIDKLDVGYVIYAKHMEVNGKEGEYAINIEEFNNENQTDSTNNEEGKKELGVKLPNSEIYSLSINEEDFIFKRRISIQELIKDVEKNKEEVKNENNTDEKSLNDIKKTEELLDKIKNLPEEDKIIGIIKEFVKINTSIFGDSDDYVTAYVYDGPDHKNEIAEIKIRIRKGENGELIDEDYKFNSLPDQLYESTFSINPLIVGLFDIWKNSILAESKYKKDYTAGKNDATNVEYNKENAVKESFLYEDSNDNNLNGKGTKLISGDTSIQRNVDEYNRFVKEMSSKIKTLYNSYISLKENKYIDGSFINDEFYNDEIKNRTDFSNFPNAKLVQTITKLMNSKVKEPPEDKHYYIEFDNIFPLEDYLKFEGRMNSDKDDKLEPDDVYRIKIKKIFNAIKQLKLLEEEYTYDIREELIKYYNNFKDKKQIPEDELTKIKTLLGSIFAISKTNTESKTYASYYAYTLIKIILNKLIDKINELKSIVGSINEDEDSEGKEKGKDDTDDTDESIYAYVENFIELNKSYPNEDDIEKYKNVIKEMKANKNNMNKVKTLLVERLREKGILDAQYTIDNVELVYEDSIPEGFFNKIKRGLSILFGKKYVTTKDFLSNRKIKGSIFEDAIKYSYLTLYYENMFNKDKKERYKPSHPRVTEEIKKIVEVIPEADRITLDKISKYATMDVGIYFGLNPQNILSSLNENKKFTNEFKQDAWLSKTYFTNDNEIASSVIVKGNETIGYVQAYNKLKILKSLLNRFRGRG